VRSSGASEATPPSSSSSSSHPSTYQTAKPTHRSTPSTSSTSSGKGVVAAPHVSSDFFERRSSIAQTEHSTSTDSNRTIRGIRSVDRISWSAEGTSGNSRSDSVETSTVVATAPVVVAPSPATALRIRPALRLRSHSIGTVSRAASIASSPQRRGNNPLTSSGTNSSITTPSTSNSESSQFWTSSPQRLRANPDRLFTSTPIIYPDEDPRAYPEIPSGSQLAPALPPKPPPASSLYPAYAVVKHSGEPLGNNLQKSKDPVKARTREHRSHSQKAMLSSALQKANTAVTLDNAENYEGAMEAYGDACVLLGQVMMRAGADEDRRKLQAIVSFLPRFLALRSSFPGESLTRPMQRL